MLIQIVDKKDKIIRYKERKDVTHDDIYRVSALWITNSKGEVLIAQRALSKKSDPGKWGPSVAGTLEKGETYNSNIIKEAFEEIGLKDINPKKSLKIAAKGEHNHFSQWYTLCVDKNIEEFKVDPIEVMAIKWISKETLIKDMKTKTSQYIRSMPRIVKDFCE